MINHSTHSTPRRLKYQGSDNLKKVMALLEYLDPDMGYGDWLKVLMAIYNESKGNEEGFEIANNWSKGGLKYKGEQEIRMKWRSFKKYSSKPVTIGTLIHMVRHQPG